MNKVNSLANQEKIYKSLLILCFFSAIFFLILLLKFAEYGFDFTDEGYYLNSIEGGLERQITYFAELIRPIYILINKNIILLRQLNILFALLLGYFSLHVTFRYFSLINISSTKDRLTNNLIIFLLSIVSLHELTGLTILTPSYNNLCFYGLLIVYLSVIFLFKNKNYLYYSLFLTVGLGFLLFSKFSSAAIVLASIIFISLIQRKSIFFTLISISLSFILFGLFITSLNDINFIDLISEIKYNYSKLKILNTHGLLQIVRSSYYYIKEFISNFNYLIFWISFNLFLFYSDSLKFKKRNFKVNLIFFIIPFYLIILLFNIKNNYFLLTFYISLPISLLILRFIYLKITINKNLFLSAVTFSIPFFYSFGTGTSYYTTGLRVPIFFLLSALIQISDFNRFENIFSSKKVYNFLLSITLISSILFFNSVLIQNQNPFRQEGNLLSYQKKIVIGKNSLLKISDKDFDYLNYAKKQLDLNGFKDGQSILDMTGRSPGFIYAVKGKPLLAPWVIGGYQNSNKLFEYLLSKEDCLNLKNSWILIEPNGPRSINQEYLSLKDIDINNENFYEEVARINFIRENVIQYLYKPIKPINKINKC